MKGGNMLKSELVKMLNDVSDDGLIMFEMWDYETSEYDYWYPEIDKVYLDKYDRTITIAM